MSLMTEAAAAADVTKERFGAALEENVRRGRRAMARVQHAAEDGRAATSLYVRRHPFSALAWAVAAGTVAGSLIGFAVARMVGSRDS